MSLPKGKKTLAQQEIATVKHFQLYLSRLPIKSQRRVMEMVQDSIEQEAELAATQPPPAPETADYRGEDGGLSLGD